MEIKPVIGWCPACKDFRQELATGCCECSNHLLTTEYALAEARKQGMMEVKMLVQQIEKIAFEIPPVNTYTPRIVQLCQAITRAAEGK
jgi:hypothetical protein